MRSPAERAIQAFHARNPGATRGVFAAGRTREGLTSYERLADVLRRCVGPGGIVLDLADGDGALGDHLVDDVGRVVLCDLSAAELAAARPGAATVRCLVQRLPLTDACVDGVGCHMALLLFDDAGEAIAEARVLRPGGVFAATVGRTNRPTGPMARPAARAARRRSTTGARAGECVDCDGP